MQLGLTNVLSFHPTSWSQPASLLTEHPQYICWERKPHPGVQPHPGDQPSLPFPTASFCLQELCVCLNTQQEVTRGHSWTISDQRTPAGKYKIIFDFGLLLDGVMVSSTHLGMHRVWRLPARQTTTQCWGISRKILPIFSNVFRLPTPVRGPVWSYEVNQATDMQRSSWTGNARHKDFSFKSSATSPPIPVVPPVKLWIGSNFWRSL